MGAKPTAIEYTMSADVEGSPSRSGRQTSTFCRLLQEVYDLKGERSILEKQLTTAKTELAKANNRLVLYLFHKFYFACVAEQ